MGKSEKKLNRIVKRRVKKDKLYENYKKTRVKRQKKAVLIRRIIAIVLGLAIFIFCITNLNYLSPGKLKERFGVIKADMAAGEGFPHKFDSGNLLYFDKFNDTDYIVLTNSKLFILNSSCNEVYNFNHGMANPVLKQSIDRILLYDQGGDELFIINQTGILLDVPVDNNIVCADICKSDDFIIVTDTESQRKGVNVYSRKGSKEFSWTSGSGYVVDAALNSGGTLAAVAIVDTDGAVRKTDIFSFSVSSGEQRGKYSFSDSMLTDLCFASGNNLMVMLNNKIARLNSKCELSKEVNLPSLNNFQLFSDSAGNIINLYSLYNNSEYNIDVYNSSLDVKHSKHCKETVKYVYSDGKNIATLYNDNLIELNKIGGKTTYYSKTEIDYDKLVCQNKNVYLCSGSILNKIKVNDRY